MIEIDDREFTLYTEEELSQPINIDGNTYACANQLLGFLKTLDEVGVEFSKKERLLLENSRAIGDENGDILFIDTRTENSPLYIFYPDGADIEKTKFTQKDLSL